LTKYFKVKNGNCKKLISYLEDIDYGGGTYLSDFETGDLSERLPDFSFIFSDGNSTFGENRKFSFKSPVYTFSSGEKVNSHYLKRISAETGGAYFDLLHERNAADKIGVPTLNFIGVEESANSVETWPIIPVRVKDRFVLTGKMKAETTQIKINYGTGGKVLFSSEFQISRTDAVKAEILQKYRAMKELDELMVYPRRNRSKILSLGKKYGLVTPYTSLLVLESVDQYVEYRIPPPETEKQMRNDYFRKIGLAENPRKKLRNRMGVVTEAWKNRIMWWNTEFKYRPKFKYKKFRYYRDDDSFGSDDFFDASETLDLDDSYFSTQEFRIRNAMIARIAPDAEGDEGFFGDGFESGPDRPKSVETINIDLADNIKPYLNALYNSDEKNRSELYWRLRSQYRNSPAFFLDCADFFHTKGEDDFAIMILSEIAELEFENEIIQRIIACKLDGMGKRGLATVILENAFESYPENPDIQFELAMLYLKKAASMKPVSPVFYKKAFQLLFGLVTNSDVDKDMAALALMEINHLLPEARKAGIKDITIPLDLIQPVDADLRIVISRFAGMENMNFSIIEPSGENVNCNHPLSLTGGYLSGGFGPEEYFVRKAMPGTYRIKTNFQGDPIEKMFGAIILKIDIYTNYGRSNEKLNSALIHMKRSKKDVVIGEVKIK
jgi:Ca-activated chloride channel family protein